MGERRAGLSAWHWLGYSTACNAAIGLFFYWLGGKGSLADNLLISMCIGYGCWLGCTLLSLRGGGRHLAWYLLVAALSVPLGFKLAAWLGAVDVLASLSGNVWRVLGPALLVAIFAMLLSTSHFRSRELAMELETTRRREAESRQAETAAQLALLQAQIEPHFLFNTLANVQSLIALDPPRAERMLGYLNTYLRASLARTRHGAGTLAQELELVGALLDIAGMRMGARLQVAVTAAPELMDWPLPPLLLQPLVENALRHGIEPSIDGGRLEVAAERDGERLRLRVSDTGVGLDPAASGGVGLANVRGRLASLYGGAARLALRDNPPHGVVAELLLPAANGAG